MKKIVYLSSDYGQGHNSAVKAVQQALDAHYPGQFIHKVVDVSTLLSPGIDKVTQFLYDKSVAYAKPSYRALFKLSDKIVKDNPRGNFYPIAKKLIEPVIDEKPDIILACFPLFIYDIGKYLKEKGIKIPLGVLVTDTGEVHMSWISKNVDFYFVPSDSTAFYLNKMGIDGEKINTFGFPVQQTFYKKWKTSKVKEKYEIPQTNKVIVYFPGALGIGKVEEKVEAIDSIACDTTILVISGRNKKLLQELKKVKYKNHVVPLGFIEDMGEILSAADLVISKAGGISVMEIITAKKPLIITEINPGQEEPNARFIESMGFGFVEKKPEKLAEKVDYIFRYDLTRLKTNLNNYHLNEHSDKMIAKYIHSLLK